ncbi:MAG: hypothetical protein IBJ11_06745 [Phycisphaerales bacterium]|nr:hypothetical protein [Phycisphaerales bacterium]
MLECVWRMAAAAGLGAVLAAAVAAEPAEGGSGATPASAGGGVLGGAREASSGGPPSGWTFRVTAESGYQFRSQLEDDRGRMSVVRTRGGASVFSPLDRTLVFGLDIEGEISNYDFRDARGLFTGRDADPADRGGFSDMYETRLRLTGIWNIDERWSVALSPVARAGWERGASFGDSITGGGFASFSYKFSDTLRLGAGVGAVTRLEDSALVIPVFTVRWDITERVRLESQGLGLKLSAQAVKDTLDVYLRAGYENRDYRLRDERPVLREGVVEDQRVPVALGLEWRPIPNLRVGVEGGAFVWQELKFRDRNGDNLHRVRGDPAAFVGLRLTYSF